MVEVRAMDNEITLATFGARQPLLLPLSMSLSESPALLGWKIVLGIVSSGVCRTHTHTCISYMGVVPTYAHVFMCARV